MRTTQWIGMAALAVAAPAQAQPAAGGNDREELARAELIAQAEAASDQGDHTRALDLATRALAVRATPSLRLLLATEHNALGHVIDAYELSTRCAREAQADPATRNRAQVIEACTALSRTLDARIGRVTLRVTSPPAGMRVRVAGGEVSQALWGVPYTVGPGRVLVEASADGREPFRQEVTVAAGQVVPVAIELRATAQANTATPPPAATTRRAPTQPDAREAAPERSLAGPIALAVGSAVSFTLAGVFFGLREGTVAERDGQCSAAGCQPTSLDLDDTARTQNTMVNVFLGVGGAALAGAVVWFFVGRPSGRTPTHATVTGALVPVQGGAVFGVGGSL